MLSTIKPDQNDGAILGVNSCDEVDWTTFTSETWVCAGGVDEGVVVLGAAVEVGR
jgi:hypothetical protein